MKYAQRFVLCAQVAAGLSLTAAVSIYWYVTAHAFGRKLDALNGHAIAPGLTLHFSSRALAGFPFRVDAVLENMRIDVATPHGPATWKAEHFALHMLDYGRLQFVLEAAGKQTISWHDEKGAAHGLSFTPALLRASANAGGGTLSRFDIELYGAATQAVAVTHSELHIRHEPDADQLDIVFMADDVHPAPDMRPALGEVVLAVTLRRDGAHVGNVSLQRLDRGRSAVDGFALEAGPVPPQSRLRPLRRRWSARLPTRGWPARTRAPDGVRGDARPRSAMPKPGRRACRRRACPRSAGRRARVLVRALVPAG